MTARRKAALRKAQLVSARKRRKNKAPRKTVRKTYSQGIAYETTTQRGVIFRGRTVHYTKAYKKQKLIGYAQTVSKKRTASVDDLYVSKDYRGTGVSRKIMQHQAHAVKGKKITITGMRSFAGDKAATRIKVRGVNPVVKKRTSNPQQIANAMEWSFAFQSAGHVGSYNKMLKKKKKNLRRKKR